MDSTTNSSTVSFIDKKLKIIELEGKAVQRKVNDREVYLRLSKKDTAYVAMTGCNTLGGSYKLSADGKLKFSSGMSTLMACNDMTVEGGVSMILPKVERYSIDGNVVTFLQGKNKVLGKFQIVDASEEQKELNGTWEVNYITGPRITFEGLYPDAKPTITFNLPETKAHGNTSCNNYNVGFTIDGFKIQFSDAASTRMACQGNGEATFLKTLKSVTSYSISDNMLTLIMGDIAVMRLEKK